MLFPSWPFDGCLLQVLVMLPTRELALQVGANFSMLSGKKLRVLCVYGGVSIESQSEWSAVDTYVTAIETIHLTNDDSLVQSPHCVLVWRLWWEHLEGSKTWLTAGSWIWLNWTMWCWTRWTACWTWGLLTLWMLFCRSGTQKVILLPMWCPTMCWTFWCASIFSKCWVQPTDSALLSHSAWLGAPDI